MDKEKIIEALKKAKKENRIYGDEFATMDALTLENSFTRISLGLEDNAARWNITTAMSELDTLGAWITGFKNNVIKAGNKGDWDAIVTDTNPYEVLYSLYRYLRGALNSENNYANWRLKDGLSAFKALCRNLIGISNAVD